VTRRPAGALEQDVLSALAACGEAMTPSQVQADLGGGLAYTTVMTALSRLHAKGAVSRERAGRAYAYRWVDQATVTARQMRRLLEAGENRETVLARFVAELKPEDERLLEDLLGEAGEALPWTPP
jgi:predicted transcriptional regulator